MSLCGLRIHPQHTCSACPIMQDCNAERSAVHHADMLVVCRMILTLHQSGYAEQKCRCHMPPT